MQFMIADDNITALVVSDNKAYIRPMGWLICVAASSGRINANPTAPCVNVWSPPERPDYEEPRHGMD